MKCNDERSTASSTFALFLRPLIGLYLNIARSSRQDINGPNHPEAKYGAAVVERGPLSPIRRDLHWHIEAINTPR
ncbi:uncharacterized protein SCHCODRAFT_02502854 [Schizophyllum commune H4-8]|uniref:Expressed protein n=1 Tax=Schizophyllum commune (strain H4-8 / FGSC 9210) TaxID=578458 RepID=D8Q4S3_SCHCM|nr:uncharacterized protein SCHCODRAFT_02502854 [Schizophyllum commune H4-8]KAI5892494.1 hypothetical protein SCHCODRAFT_02502854 [Schizophyllum commune H4-8]